MSPLIDDIITYVQLNLLPIELTVQCLLYRLGNGEGRSDLGHNLSVFALHNFFCLFGGKKSDDLTS